jgi:hypothetical protein
LIEYLDKTGAILSIVLILFVLIYLLVLFILMIRFLEQTRKMVEKNFILRWEERIFDYLSTDKTPHDVIRLFNRYGYKYILPFLRSYLLTLKGSDKDKLMKLITDTELFDYIHGQLKSVKKRKIVFGAYYLGLAKSDGAVKELKNKLKYNDEHVSIIITTLRHFKNLAAAPTVMEILSKETNKELIIEILKYLGEVEYIDASKELEFYLQSPDPDIKTETIKAVQKIGDTSLESKIWELIKDKNRNVQVSAAEAMYDISDKSREQLKNIEHKMPNTIESSIARMIIEERAIQVG